MLHIAYIIYIFILCNLYLQYTLYNIHCTIVIVFVLSFLSGDLNGGIRSS